MNSVAVIETGLKEEKASFKVVKIHLYSMFSSLKTFYLEWETAVVIFIELLKLRLYFLVKLF